MSCQKSWKKKAIGESWNEKLPKQQAEKSGQGKKAKKRKQTLIIWAKKITQKGGGGGGKNDQGTGYFAATHASRDRATWRMKTAKKKARPALQTPYRQKRDTARKTRGVKE